MTTREKTLGEALREKRDGGPKAPVYRELGVPANTYNTWESGMYLPSEPVHIQRIAKYLGVEEDTLALRIYHERKQQVGGYVALFAQPIPALAA